MVTDAADDHDDLHAMLTVAIMLTVLVLKTKGDSNDVADSD